MNHDFEVSTTPNPDNDLLPFARLAVNMLLSACYDLSRGDLRPKALKWLKTENSRLPVNVCLYIIQQVLESQGYGVIDEGALIELMDKQPKKAVGVLRVIRSRCEGRVGASLVDAA